MAFAEEQIVYRDLTGPWGSYRLLDATGRDRTMFRGAPVQIGGYQLTDPYTYGPADFRFPKITVFEDHLWGTGDLDWFDLGKDLRLIQVDADGNYVRDVWRGFMSQIETSDGADVHCDGEASGRLSLKDKHDEIFYWTKDIGRLVWGAFNKCGLRMSPHLSGIVTGIEVYERGRSGGTFLDYTDQLLDEGKTDGSKLTVTADGDGGYTQEWRDLTTVHASVDLGAAGVDFKPSRDLQEEPTTIYGHGRQPDGLLWTNAKAPGLTQGAIPPFPGTLQLNDTGENVQALQGKLIGMNYLDAEDAIGNTFNAETEDAVKALQEDRGVAQTGVVNKATWDALYNLNVTGFSLRQAFVAPLAQLSEVKKQLRTGDGSIYGFNPDHDPARKEVDLTIDWGVNYKKRARKASKRELALIHGGTHPPIVGVLELSTDLAVGAHTYGTPPSALMSRLDAWAGMNVQVDNYRGGSVLFHVAGINVDSDMKVRMALDTKGRDLRKVGAILERNRESRINRGRVFLQDRRPTGPHSKIVEWLEFGGFVDMTVDCPAMEWTVFPVPAGQSGWINEIRIQVEDSACEFVAAASCKRTGPAWWRRLAADPFGEWNRERLFEQYDNQKAILNIWGRDDQPGGYAPGFKTDENGEATGDPITGLLLDQGGFPFWTFPGEEGGQPVLWVAVFPKQATKIKPQRIFRHSREAGM